MLDILFVLGPILPTIITWLYVILIISIIQNYLVTSLSTRRLLTLSGYPKPNLAFIPFSTVYFIGYLAFNKQQNVLYSTETLHAARKKSGIRSLFLLIIIPIVLISVLILSISQDLITVLSSLTYSPENATLPPVSPLLPIGIILVGIISLWMLAYSLYLQYHAYKKFVPSNYETILWILVPLVIVISPLASYSFVWPMLVSFTPLIFAYNRASITE